jgi:hypothetical protein
MKRQRIWHQRFHVVRQLLHFSTQQQDSKAAALSVFVK